MRAITAISKITPDFHINGWLHWTFTYLPVSPTPGYVKTLIAPHLGVRQYFEYSPQVLFGCQYCFDVCLAIC